METGLLQRDLCGGNPKTRQCGRCPISGVRETMLLLFLVKETPMPALSHVPLCTPSPVPWDLFPIVQRSMGRSRSRSCQVQLGPETGPPCFKALPARHHCCAAAARAGHEVGGDCRVWGWGAGHNSRLEGAAGNSSGILSQDQMWGEGGLLGPAGASVHNQRTTGHRVRDGPKSQSSTG